MKKEDFVVIMMLMVLSIAIGVIIQSCNEKKAKESFDVIVEPSIDGYVKYGDTVYLGRPGLYHCPLIINNKKVNYDE